MKKGIIPKNKFKLLVSLGFLTLITIFLFLVIYPCYQINRYLNSIAEMGNRDEIIISVHDDLLYLNIYTVKFISPENNLELLESLQPPKNLSHFFRNYIPPIRIKGVSMEAVRRCRVTLKDANDVTIKGRVENVEDVEKMFFCFPNVNMLELDYLAWDKEIEKLFRSKSPKLHFVMSAESSFKKGKTIDLGTGEVILGSQVE